MPSSSPVWVSPVTWAFPDYAGKAVSVTFVFDNTTFALTAVTVVTQPGCLYKNIYFGLGAGGTPETTLVSFPNIVSSVPRVITAATLAGFGFTTMNDIAATGNITAGP